MLDELIHEQSSRWENIARDHVTTIADLVFEFTQSALAFVIKDENARDNIRRHITATLDGNAKCALDELSKLIEDEAGCPITYNHYYTDNVQNARNNRSKQDTGTSLKSTIQHEWKGRSQLINSPDEINRLVASIQNHAVIVDMEELACYEAQIDLDAYYKVNFLSPQICGIPHLVLTTY